MVVSKEVEEKQLWMHQYSVNNYQEVQNNKGNGACESDHSPSFNDCDVECLRVSDVSNCAINGDNF